MQLLAFDAIRAAWPADVSLPRIRAEIAAHDGSDWP
jgi:hypothetical protein